MGFSLKNLLGLAEPAAEPLAPSIPSGRRVYAIGDIHGRLDLLDQLLAAIDADKDERGPADTCLIFLGDLIDRGPDSFGVVERAMALRDAGGDVRFILGNHEEILLAALEGREGAMRFFVRIGGAETLASYGLSEEEIYGDRNELANLADARIPATHKAFIASFEDHVLIGDYLFVHAGIRPGVAVEDQVPADLRWIRDAFLDHRGDYGHIVVHGHTIRPEVEDVGNRIGIDTGAFETGRLTALGLEGDRRWLLATIPIEAS